MTQEHNSELWHLLFELQLLSREKIDVYSYSKEEIWLDDDVINDFDPASDENYRDALLKAKESQPAEVWVNESGDWNLL